MDMHAFPFDHQVRRILPCHFSSNSGVCTQIFKINFESFHWKAEDLTLIRLDSHAVQVRNNFHHGASHSFNQLRPRPGTDERWLTIAGDIKLSVRPSEARVQILTSARRSGF